MNKINVIITDDHLLFTSGIKNILDKYDHINIVGVYNNGTDLLDNIQKDVVQIILLDIQMPDKTGDQLASTILAEYPATKIIALTSFDSGLYINKMLEIGISGYLLKTVEEYVLLDAIYAVANGETFIDPTIAERGLIQQQSTKRATAMRFTLTKREMEILKLIADGYTTAEIAQALFLSQHTVTHYRDNIHLKLEVNNIASLIKKALKIGLIN